MKTPRLKVGDVFSVQYYVDQPIRYYKVTSIHDASHGQSYNVISCSKKGKEYKGIDGFSTNIDSYFDEVDSTIKIVSTSNEVGIKANIDEGIASGKRLRRITFLETKIKSYYEELNRLKG